MLISMHCAVAVYDINKSTMREKDHYELVFVRYLYNTHNDDICCLASVSSKYCTYTCSYVAAGQATEREMWW